MKPTTTRPVLDTSNLPMHNSTTITDYAFNRDRSPSGGIVSQQELNDALYSAPTFGYTVDQWSVTDPDGHPMDVVRMVKSANPAAEADKRLILDTAAEITTRMAAFERHNNRAAGTHADPLTWTTHHLYVIRYFTRVECYTDDGHYAARYATVTDDNGVTTHPRPYCGTCLRHLYRSADDAGHTVTESAPLRIGQHD
jgi:hypothetical protein